MVTYIWLIFRVNLLVGTCTSPMDPMGMIQTVIIPKPKLRSWEDFLKQSRSACSLVPHVLQLQYFTKLRKYGNKEDFPFKATPFGMRRRDFVMIWEEVIQQCSGID